MTMISNWVKRGQTMLAEIGSAGVIGLGVLAFCGGFFVSTLAPASARLKDLKQLVESKQSGGSRLGVQGGGAEKNLESQLTRFYGFFLEKGALSDRLGKIYEAAKHQGIFLATADYTVVASGIDSLGRYQITLPVRSSYIQIRRFLDETLRNDPALILDGIQFERQNIGESIVKTKIRFSILLEKS